MQMRSGVLIALWLCLSLNEGLALLENEGETINRCIQNYGGLTAEIAERLERFKDWSDGYEEIPCFTRCYLSGMFDFYSNLTGFNKAGIVEVFGSSVYEACRHKLEQPFQLGESSCKHAYEGFHCITNMENHPFTLIENMPNISPSAKSAMKDCLQIVHLDEWKKFVLFADYPVNEPIPCFTRCFVDKLHIFEEKTRLWKLEAMKQHLGVPAKGVRVGNCHRQRGKDRCATYYKQFTCYTLAD
ncbi:uncharacterized protein LOC6552801 [Drosophila erecta]|uniref:GG13108 n=1 Tax=Drosophila erecta TaxID=7220 RepID=B3NYK6_DROER|nr:uncharacterized protein LOC6552801 [Drosophila erecta]EDV47987.1 Odorant-binding protein 83cd [Drosophila erecta]